MYTSCSLFDACRYLRQSFAWLSREKLPLKQVKLQYYVLQYLIVTHLPSGLYTCPSCQATEVFFVLLRQVHQQMIPPHFPTAKRKCEAAKKKRYTILPRNTRYLSSELLNMHKDNGDIISSLSSTCVAFIENQGENCWPYQYSSNRLTGPQNTS